MSCLLQKDRLFLPVVLSTQRQNKKNMKKTQYSSKMRVFAEDAKAAIKITSVLDRLSFVRHLYKKLK